MKKLLREYVETNLKEKVAQPAESKADNNNAQAGKKEDSTDFSGLYRRVQNRLDNDLWNHAAVMRRLNWDGDDNTNRSLFEKKLKRADNDTGGQYTFTQEELEKIITILDTEGKE